MSMQDELRRNNGGVGYDGLEHTTEGDHGAKVAMMVAGGIVLLFLALWMFGAFEMPASDTPRSDTSSASTPTTL